LQLLFCIVMFKHFERDLLCNWHSTCSVPPIGVMLYNALLSLKKDNWQNKVVEV
jgi:hypothetical protein